MEKQLNLAEVTWSAISRQTQLYIGLTMEQMEELIKEDGGEQAWEHLPLPIRVWADTQYTEQTEIFQRVQGATLTINGLRTKFKKSDVYKVLEYTEETVEDLSKHIAWAWHLLHYGE